MRGHNPQPGRLAHDGEVRLESFRGQRARTALPVFFIHQTGEDDFRPARSPSRAGQFHQRRQHRRHAAFGVARAAAVEPPILFARPKNFR